MIKDREREEIIIYLLKRIIFESVIFILITKQTTTEATVPVLFEKKTQRNERKTTEFQKATTCKNFYFYHGKPWQCTSSDAQLAREICRQMSRAWKAFHFHGNVDIFIHCVVFIVCALHSIYRIHIYHMTDTHTECKCVILSTCNFSTIFFLSRWCCWVCFFLLSLKIHYHFGFESNQTAQTVFGIRIFSFNNNNNWTKIENKPIPSV